MKRRFSSFMYFIIKSLVNFLLAIYAIFRPDEAHEISDDVDFKESNRQEVENALYGDGNCEVLIYHHQN